MAKILENQKEIILIAINIVLFVILIVVSLIFISSLARSLVTAIETGNTAGTTGIRFDFDDFKALNLQIK